MVNKDLPKRTSKRLENYNYASEGVYFVTVCTHQGQEILGSIIGDEMHLSELGAIVSAEWARTPVVRPEVILDQWVVMPNHLHGIIVITDSRATQRVAPYIDW